MGCSPAWPNPGGAHSGYLVEGPGRLLLDCGPGVLARLRDGAGPWPRVDAVLVSHWHLDHWGDLVPWAWGAMVGPGRRAEHRPELWLPAGGTEVLARFGSQLGTETMFSETFRLREYREDEPFEAAGFSVLALRVPHYGLETYGFRVSDGVRSLAYSGDSAPSDRLVELARGADLFLCEATLERAELEGEPRGHLTPDEAVAAFTAAGARRLLLTHRPVELGLDSGLERAYDGFELEL